MIPCIGLDFDNTIVCYDQVFHTAALELNLIPSDLPVTKENVRDHLRKSGREDEWTRLQGFVYGMRMDDARIFPGLFDFFRNAKLSGYKICIVSHKTKMPYLGPAYDLHASALNWLEKQRFFDPEIGGLNRENVFFELTKQDKLKRIKNLGCRIFIDDLPEFLSESDFPVNVQRVLFSPGNVRAADPRWQIVQSWAEFSKFVTEYFLRHGA
jgi:hypothetical protein